MTMSNMVLLIVIVLTCIFTEAAAQVVCVNPIEIGELRVMNSKKCLNIPGTDGHGDIRANVCDGNHDQQYIMCEDGTIRNFKAPYNCVTPGTNGKGNIRSTSCEVYPSIPDYQKWRYGRSKTFIDTGGIQQEAREIKNVKSGACINVAGHHGYGDIYTYRCENADDQYFYFRSRGKLMGHGRLQVEKSGLCLDVAGNQGRGNVFINNCEDAADQYFDFFENGELVNKRSGLCVNVAGTDGTGNIDTYHCEDLPDQMWTRTRHYCLGDYCSFRNEKSGHCMNIAGYDAKRESNVFTYRCEGTPDQRYRWVNEKWVTPTATWTMVGCNQNGEVSQQISNTVSYRTKITTSLSNEVSSTISAGFSFGVSGGGLSGGLSAGVSVTTTVSTSLAKEWENSQSGTQSITFACKNYDSGNTFAGGCMWQLKLTTNKGTKKDLLTWSPKIVKCTRNSQEPKCPPFTKCKDDACTMCEAVSGARKKRILDESLTWKKVLKIE